METKLIAADIATAAGVTTIITSSKDPKSIFNIIEYHNSLRSGSSTPAHTRSGRSSPIPYLPTAQQLPTPDSITPSPSPSVGSTPFGVTRPPHTVFKPSPAPLRDLKSWTSHTLHPSGTVIIDRGAHTVLSRRESGGRLLPAGVIGVRGAFASGQAVRIVVQKRAAGAMHETHIGAPELGTSTPNTPLLLASASVSSSISTLDPGLELMDVATHALSIVDEEVTPSVAQRVLEDEHVLVERPVEENEEWEVEEVGRGLANYNSVQIDRVKGLKR